MSTKQIAFVAEPIEAAEAQGVRIRRSIGSERLIMLDPFLLLDHLTVPAGEGSESVGFPRHPHRGIETLTIVLSGEVNHRDSLGNDDTISKGAVQWMTAGSGIWHSEMLVGHADGNDSIQLWFNLPAAQKFVAPAYVAKAADQIPQVPVPAGFVRVIAGEYFGVKGAVSGIAVNPLVLHIHLEPGPGVTVPIPSGFLGGVYAARGSFESGTKTVAEAQLGVLGADDAVRLRATDAGPVDIILFAAAPLNEPVMQYRSIVLNTSEQMAEAVDQIAAGTFPV
jgi:hypothetical protein